MQPFTDSEKEPEIGFRFHRHCLGLGFNPAPGDPAAYNYNGDGARGSLAIHVDDALTRS